MQCSRCWLLVSILSPESYLSWIFYLEEVAWTKCLGTSLVLQTGSGWDPQSVLPPLDQSDHLRFGLGWLGWSLGTSESSRVSLWLGTVRKRDGRRNHSLKCVAYSETWDIQPRTTYPSWKHCGLRNCPLVTMATIQQLHLGSLKGYIVADKS